MQTQTICRYTPHSHQDGYYKTKHEIASVGKDVEILEPLDIAGANVNGAVVKNSNGSSSKQRKKQTNTELLEDPAVSLLGEKKGKQRLKQIFIHQCS